MSKLNEETQRDYAVLMSRDISNADQEFIDKFAEITSEDLEKITKELGFEDTYDENGKLVHSAEYNMARAFGYSGINELEAGIE
jgi:hypothetical protein